MKESWKEKLQRKVREIFGNEQGVTLIELLAVVVILAIIAAVAVPSVLSNFNTSKVNTDKQNAAIIVDAINRLITDEDSINGGNVTAVSVATLDAAELTGTKGGATTGDDGTALSVLLENGGKDVTNSYMNTVPTPQSSTTATSKFQISKTAGTGNYADFPSFNIGSTTYYVYPN